MTNNPSLRRWLVLGASAMAFGAMAAPAMAAEAQAGAAAQDQATTIDTLVVTAEKREQSLQDVPIAISAFGAKQRDLKGINTVQDMTNFTPGLVYSSSNDRASVRGVGRLTNVHAVDAAVAIYIDGVYTTSTVLAGGPPLMVDRVEVLRGPQGTLYGRNSIGGTINILSPHPTNHWYGEVRAIGENYGYSDFQGVISGPITDNLKFRLSGYKKDQRDGYFHNVVPNMPTEGAKRNEYAVELQAEANLGDKLTVWGKIGTLHWDNRGGPGARAGIGPVGGPPYEEALSDPNFSVIYNPAFGYSSGIVPGSLVNLGNTTVNPAATDPRAFNTNTPLSVKLTNVFLSSWNVKYSFPTFDLKYIGGWQKYHYSLHGDLDGTAVQSYQTPLATGSICGQIHAAFATAGSGVTTDCSPLTVTGTTTYDYQELPTWWSHEINLTSTTDGPLQWILGAYYYHESYSNPYNFYQPNQTQLYTPQLATLTGLPTNAPGGYSFSAAAPNPDGGFAYSNYNMVTKSTAVFGQVDYKVTDTLKFTVGLRYTRDTKYGTETKRVISFTDGVEPLLYLNNVASGIPLIGIGPFSGAAIGANGTSANWGSLYGNINAAASVLPQLGAYYASLGIATPYAAFAALAGKGNGGIDLTKILAPTTTAAGAKGVCTPVTATPNGSGGFTYTQYTIDPTTGMFTRALCDSSSATTGTAGVEWSPSSDLMVYGRYSRGYKAFGLSAGGGLAAPEAAPEHVDSFEVGFKKDFGHTLQFDLAAFYYNYTDLQAPVSVRVGSTNVTQFVNIAQSRSMGVEIDAIWQPVDHLQLSMDYSYNPTKILKSDNFVDLNDNVNTGAKSIVGNKLPQAPVNKIAINGNYTFVLNSGKLNVGANFIWRDKAYSNIFTERWNMAPSWSQVDLRGSWTPNDGRYQVIVYVKNVGNTLGYDSAVTASNRDATNFPINTGYNTSFTPPRTYGIEVHYKFF